jgi:hypothetical protein
MKSWQHYIMRCSLIMKWTKVSVIRLKLWSCNSKTCAYYKTETLGDLEPPWTFLLAERHLISFVSIGCVLVNIQFEDGRQSNI